MPRYVPEISEYRLFALSLPVPACSYCAALYVSLGSANMHTLREEAARSRPKKYVLVEQPLLMKSIFHLHRAVDRGNQHR
jgi:hypothetical protein